MTCAHCVGSERFFNRRRARRDLKRYQKKGPDASTRLLLDALVQAGIQDRSMLDVGGGVGALQLELLASGAHDVINVDASPAYQELNRELAGTRGLADRITYRSGDFVELAPRLPPTDVVTLDRVICCYPDMAALVDASAACARRLYGFVAPRERRITRSGIALANLFFRLRRNPFRVFVHPLAAVDTRLRSHGLVPLRRARTVLWEACVYERPTSPPGA